MVIDTSAIIAIFLGEPEADRFDEAIGAAKVRLLPATCLLEARMVLVTRRDERSVNELDLWLLKAGVDAFRSMPTWSISPRKPGSSTARGAIPPG